MSAHPKAQAPAWALGLGTVLLLGAALAALAVLAVLGGRSVPENAGPPAEEQELAVERTVLSPDAIELTVRNTSPEPVQIAQVFVNDVYVDLAGATEPIDRLGTDTVRLDYPWQEGQPYLVSMLTSTGSVVEHEIPAAADTSTAGPSYFWWMAALGSCVGIVAVLLGMLFLPALHRTWPPAVRMLLAVTVGLLAVLVLDGVATGVELAGRSGAAFGGAALVVIAATVAYLLLAGVDHGLRHGQQAECQPSLPAAIRTGLLNVCAGLAIGSAYGVGEVALGAALVIGVALHNATEGDAVVAPLTDHQASAARLLTLAVVAGAPAVVGILLGASVGNAELSTFLLGIGLGAIVHAVVRLLPRLRDRAGGIRPSTLYGVLTGVLFMYVTGLLLT